jgi:hypothetical protein
MKRRIVVTGFVAVLVASSVLLLGMKGVEPVRQRTITALGTATITVTPDSARLYLSVSTTGKTVTEARQKNAKRVAAVRAAILALKLPDVRTKTLDVAVAKVHGKPADENAPGPLIGYKVTHEFSVLVKDSNPTRLNTAASRVLDTALDNGVDTTDNLSFFKEDISESERLAMSQAVRDALANARAYAKGADVKIAEVVVINGDAHGQVPSYVGGQQGQVPQGLLGIGVSSSFLAGKSRVTCSVRVTCRF